MQPAIRKRPNEFIYYLPSGSYTVELVCIIFNPLSEIVACPAGNELMLKIVCGEYMGRQFSVCDFEGDYGWLIHCKSKVFRIKLTRSKCPQCEYGYSVTFEDFRALERGKMLSVV